MPKVTAEVSLHSSSPLFLVPTSLDDKPVFDHLWQQLRAPTTIPRLPYVYFALIGLKRQQ